MTNRLIWSMMWGFGGSMSLAERENFSSFIQGIVSTPVPEQSFAPLLDFAVNLDDGVWHLYKSKVPAVEVDTHKVTLFCSLFSAHFSALFSALTVGCRLPLLMSLFPLLIQYVMLRYYMLGLQNIVHFFCADLLVLVCFLLFSFFFFLLYIVNIFC
jgi:Dynein heavy chain AAA lid domain